MSKHYEKHAQQVAGSFIDMLESSVAARITEEHRNELAMLVEAAISTAVLTEMERAADAVAALSQQLRQHAEYYDG